MSDDLVIKRDNKYYAQGRKAYSDLVPVDDCPYPPRIGTGHARTSWICGWYDNKYEQFWDNWLSKQKLGDLAKIKGILTD